MRLVIKGSHNKHLPQKCSCVLTEELMQLCEDLNALITMTCCVSSSDSFPQEPWTFTKSSVQMCVYKHFPPLTHCLNNPNSRPCSVSRFPTDFFSPSRSADHFREEKKRRKYIFHLAAHMSGKGHCDSLTSSVPLFLLPVFRRVLRLVKIGTHFCCMRCQTLPSDQGMWKQLFLTFSYSFLSYAFCAYSLCV